MSSRGASDPAAVMSSASAVPVLRNLTQSHATSGFFVDLEIAQAQSRFAVTNGLPPLAVGNCHVATTFCRFLMGAPPPGPQSYCQAHDPDVVTGSVPLTKSTYL